MFLINLCLVSSVIIHCLKKKASLHGSLTGQALPPSFTSHHCSLVHRTDSTLRFTLSLPPCNILLHAVLAAWTITASLVSVCLSFRFHLKGHVFRDTTFLSQSFYTCYNLTIGIFLFFTFAFSSKSVLMFIPLCYYLIDIFFIGRL